MAGSNLPSPDDQPVKIAEVARDAGVGLATASRALNQTGSVKPATREKVLAVARELGCVARPAMAALASMRQSSRRGQDHLPVAVLTRAINLPDAAGGIARQLSQVNSASGYRFEGFDTLQFADPKLLACRLHHTGSVSGSKDPRPGEARRVGAGKRRRKSK